MLKTTLLATLLFSSALLSSASAQEKQATEVAGQEAIAEVNELWAAIDLLYAYPVTREEIEDFYSTMASLTAWSRMHQYEWNGMTESYPTLEAIRGFTYWEEIGRSPEPFCTTFSKLSLLSSNADPDNDARDRAAEYIEHHEKLLADNEVQEEDMEMVLEGVATAKEHLIQLNSIPEKNRVIYALDSIKIDALLDAFFYIGLLPEQPEVAFQSSAQGLRMRASGTWSRSDTDFEPVFNLADFSCYLGMDSVPWAKNQTLDATLIKQIIAARIEKDNSLEFGALQVGELNGSPNYRLPFQVNGEHPRGLLFATVVEDVLYILIFRFTAEEEDLLQPIFIECCINLEFGEFEPPLLLDRSEIGYQIFADAPWSVSEAIPPSVEPGLSFGQLPILVDFAMTNDIDFGLETFTEVLPTLTEYIRKDFLIPSMKEPRMIEVDGLPCAVIQGSGILLNGPEAFIGAVQVKQNYYILNGDRIIHVLCMGEQDLWRVTEPIIEKLVLGMKIPRIAPMLGPVPVLLNQSEHGFLVYARDSWSTHYDEANDGWDLTHGDDPFHIFLSVHKDVESVPEQIQSNVQSAREADALMFENPTLSEVSVMEVNELSFTTYEIHGAMKTEYATYPGETEHYLRAFIPQENQILQAFVSGKHDSWDESRSSAFKLIGNIYLLTPEEDIVNYEPATSLLVDRAVVGYQIHANGLWQLAEKKEETLDASILSKALGCYISVTVVAGTIPPADLAGNLEKFHKSYMGEFVEPHSVNSGIIEIDGQRCAISEVYGVKAEGTNYAGVDLHERQIFLPKENHLVHFSIRTTTDNWEAAAPHIEDLINNLKFSK